MIWKIISLILLPISSSLAYGGDGDIPITKPIILMGDSQEHERHGTFTLVAGSWVDSLSKVAARSPQMDLYTKYSMEDVIKTHTQLRNPNPLQDGEFAIHLGDFLDISCESEWNRFIKITKPYIESGKMVLGVGNHDGFYIGNYAFDDMRSHSYVGGKSWRDRCSAGAWSNYRDADQNIMHKGKLVKDLIDQLKSISKTQPKYQDDNSPQYLSSLTDSNYCPQKAMRRGKLKVSDSWTVYFQYPLKLKESCQDQNKSIDLSTDGEYWRSYFVSVVSLPKTDDSAADVKMIIMDPSQANSVSESFFTTLLSTMFNFPEIIKGHVQPDQRVLIESLLNEPCDVSASQCLKILAGHHPLKDYGYSTKNWVKKLIFGSKDIKQQGNSQTLNLYVSAHTHDGYIEKTDGINELNIGALIENNPHYRTFWISQDSGTNHYIANTHLNSLIGESKSRCSPIKWSFLNDFPEDYKGGNQYQDKYAYLEQSRQAFLQAFERIQKTAGSGNEDALRKIADPKLNLILEKMNIWSDEVDENDSELKYPIKRHCYKNTGNQTESSQTEYWKPENYESIPNTIELLKKMGGITSSLKGKLNDKQRCNGENEQAGYYLAHTESHFLSLLQDWFESLGDNVFIVNGEEQQMGYRACIARFAAEQDEANSKFQSNPTINKIKIDIPLETP